MERDYASWAEAFTIFVKYESTDYDSVSAEHDIVYAGPNPRTVSLSDIRRLRQLGWHIHKKFGYADNRVEIR